MPASRKRSRPSSELENIKIFEQSFEQQVAQLKNVGAMVDLKLLLQFLLPVVATAAALKVPGNDRCPVPQIWATVGVYDLVEWGGVPNITLDTPTPPYATKFSAKAIETGIVNQTTCFWAHYPVNGTHQMGEPTFGGGVRAAYDRPAMFPADGWPGAKQLCFTGSVYAHLAAQEALKGPMGGKIHLDLHPRMGHPKAQQSSPYKPARHDGKVSTGIVLDNEEHCKVAGDLFLATCKAGYHHHAVFTKTGTDALLRAADGCNLTWEEHQVKVGPETVSVYIVSGLKEHGATCDQAIVVSAPHLCTLRYFYAVQPLAAVFAVVAAWDDGSSITDAAKMKALYEELVPAVERARSQAGQGLNWLISYPEWLETLSDEDLTALDNKNASLDQDMTPAKAFAFVCGRHGGDVAREAWLADAAGEATPEQQKIVKKQREGLRLANETMADARMAVAAGAATAKQQEMVKKQRAGLAKGAAQASAKRVRARQAVSEGEYRYVWLIGAGFSMMFRCGTKYNSRYPGVDKAAKERAAIGADLAMLGFIGDDTIKPSSLNFSVHSYTNPVGLALLEKVYAAAVICRRGSSTPFAEQHDSWGKHKAWLLALPNNKKPAAPSALLETSTVPSAIAKNAALQLKQEAAGREAGGRPKRQCM